jgi:hypothetical protein
MDPPGGQVTTPIDEFGDYAALDPFFRIIEEGLAGFVDDGHFFDLLAEDVIFDYVISVPGYPRRVEGRRAVAELYRGYGSNMVLRSADNSRCMVNLMTRLAVAIGAPPSMNAVVSVFQHDTDIAQCGHDGDDPLTGQAAHGE